MAEFTLQEAARHLGVHYMTVYRYVRLGLIPARKVAGSWRVGADDLVAFRQPVAGRPPSGATPWAKRLEARMMAGDCAGAWSVVEAAMASGASPEQVYTELLGPAMAAVGERWAAGDAGVEDEHLASAVAARLIGKLSPRFTRRGRRKERVVVTTTPPGERHGLGVAMLADVLRGRGFDVLELGPDLPAERLVAILGRVSDLGAVCLSVMSTDSLEPCAVTLRKVKQEMPGVAVLVGGRAVTSAGQAEAMGADGYSPDISHAADLLEQLVGE